MVKIKTWLKGGLISLGIYFVLIILNSIRKWLFPTFEERIFMEKFIFYYTIYLRLPFFTFYLLIGILFILIGILIGFIIQKIKSKKQVIR